MPGDLPVAVADRLRAEGLRLEVDSAAVQDRRRVNLLAELDGIRRAQRAAEAGMAAAEALIRGASHAGDDLEHEGEPLTSETVRAAVRAACAAAGAPAPPDIMVVSLRAEGGTIPAPARSRPVSRSPSTCGRADDASGCWADMTRTFVNGEVTAPVAALRDVARAALEAARAAARPGITGRALYDVAAEIVEQAGFPTQRTRTPGETLSQGFYFGLGHGVGLEVHEAPGLGPAGGETLVAGDVVAIEPGVEGIEGIGGVRFEDLLLITADGCETLTDYRYEL